MTRRSWAIGAGALIVAKLAVGAVVLASGFHAVSDDDFARVVIAQRFAEAPALDPTGTSWLPLPFWIYGVAQRWFGATLLVARVTAIVLGVASVLALLVAGRCLGLRPRAAWLGALIAAVLPYSAYLGVATVPEAPAAALTVLGAATLALTGPERIAGALALTLACASRYESWAVAIAFAAISLWQAARSRAPRLALAGLTALLFPVAWLLHGVVWHGDPWFFVARVAAYQSALGVRAPTALEALLRAPRALVQHEPELFAALLVLGTALALVARGRGLPELRESRALGPALALLSVLALLVAGDLRGSAPTHHGERALLPLWYGAALLLGYLLDRALELATRPRATALSAGALSVVVTAATLRPAFPRDGFANRAAEIAIGERARARGIERLAIDAPDYGFFAVQAAFGSPSRTHVLDTRDPRAPRSSDRVQDDPAGLARSLVAQEIRWLATPTAHASTALGVVRETHAGWALVELRSFP